MTLRSFAGWRGVAVGIVFVALGIWAFAYTCNTETAACKGAEPWPTLPGLLYRAGWVMAILGLVVMVASLAAWVRPGRPKTIEDVIEEDPVARTPSRRYG